jgi:hypothetical protein
MGEDGGGGENFKHIQILAIHPLPSIPSHEGRGRVSVWILDGVRFLFHQAGRFTIGSVTGSGQDLGSNYVQEWRESHVG